MSQLTPSPRRSPRQSQAESRSGRGSGRKKRESPGSGRKKRSPRPQPEPEPEAVYDSPSRPEPAPEPAYDDSPDPVLESSHLDTSHLLADVDSSHMLADKEHFSMIVEKEDRQDLRLEEIASEAQALLELAGEARKQRKRAQERARRHLEMGRSLVATAVLGDGKHDQAMKEYNAAALLVGECTAKEVKTALERHGVEFEEEYRRLLEANAAGAFESSGGKKSRDYVGALGLLQRKAREYGLPCGWQGTSKAERELAKEIEDARAVCAWERRSGQYRGHKSDGLTARQLVQQVYEEGVKHAQAGRYRDACGFFAEALELKLDDRGMAKKIGAALRDAEAALKEQARNRAEAEQHRIAGKQLVDAALREEYRAKQDGGSRKAVALWKKAVGEFEAGLRLARKKVTDDPNLVRAKHNSAPCLRPLVQEALSLSRADCQVRDLERDLDAALKRRDAKEPANLRKVASQIVDRTKQDATALLAAGRKLLGDNDYEGAEAQFESAVCSHSPSCPLCSCLTLIRTICRAAG